MQHARERLYLTSDRSRLVRQGDPRASFLYAAEGDEIPDSAAQKFGIVNGRLMGAAKPAALPPLYGSNILPALVVISDTLTVQLGDVVAASHKQSGLSVEDWNALPALEREAKLQATIDAMRAEAAKPAKPRAPAAPKKATAPKAALRPAGKEQAPPANKEQSDPENKGG